MKKVKLICDGSEQLLSFEEAQAILQHQEAMKLHGSWGWRLPEDSEFYFDKSTNGLFQRTASEESKSEAEGNLNSD